MISTITLFSSSSSSMIRTFRINPPEKGITGPQLIFLRHLSWESVENPLCLNQDIFKIIFLLLISKTSAAIASLSKTKQESFTLNKVFMTKFPSKKLPSSCLTLTFLALFHIYNLHATCFLMTEMLAVVSTTTSTSSPTRCNVTHKREVYRGVYLTPDDVLLIRFQNPLLN